MTKVWTTEEIRSKLQEGNRTWVEHAVKAIYTINQTSDEKAIQDTKHRNGIGFNGSDAFILSSFAEQIIKGRHLSVKQFAIAHKKIVKYAKQLTTIANKEE